MKWMNGGHFGNGRHRLPHLWLHWHCKKQKCRQWSTSRQSNWSGHFNRGAAALRSVRRRRLEDVGGRGFLQKGEKSKLSYCHCRSDRLTFDSSLLMGRSLASCHRHVQPRHKTKPVHYLLLAVLLPKKQSYVLSIIIIGGDTSTTVMTLWLWFVSPSFWPNFALFLIARIFI